LDGQSDSEEMDRVSRESSLSPPPDDNFTAPNLEEESGQSAIAENLDGLTAGHKPITSDLPSAKSIGKRKEHVEMV
jgi:hypothetical protein